MILQLLVGNTFRNLNRHYRGSESSLWTDRLQSLSQDTLNLVQKSKKKNDLAVSAWEISVINRNPHQRGSESRHSTQLSSISCTGGSHLAVSALEVSPKKWNQHQQGNETRHWTRSSSIYSTTFSTASFESKRIVLHFLH